MAQLAVRSLLTPEICSSNPNIGKIFKCSYPNTFMKKTKIGTHLRDKETGEERNWKWNSCMVIEKEIEWRNVHKGKKHYAFCRIKSYVCLVTWTFLFLVQKMKNDFQKSFSLQMRFFLFLKITFSFKKSMFRLKCDQNFSLFFSWLTQKSFYWLMIWTLEVT